MSLAPTTARLPEGELRASDAERQEAATELQDHFAKGRLSWEELDERLGLAWAARTRGELSVLFTDLPAAPVAAAEVAPPARRRFRPRYDPRLFGALLFGVALIALTRGMILIPLIAFIVIRGHHHGRRFGRSSFAGGSHHHHHPYGRGRR